MDKIKELKSRLRYNQKNGFILTGKDVKTIIDLLEETSDYNVKTIKLQYTNTELINLTDKVLLDLTGTDKAIDLLNVSCSFSGTPMNEAGGIWVYLGEVGTAISMYSGAPLQSTNQHYYFRRTSDIGFNDLNRQKICISSQDLLTGGDTDTLITIYITYSIYAN